MNILFFNNAEISPVTNGIQRITHVLSQAFAKEGINCYSAYFENNPVEPKADFIEKIKLTRGNEQEELEAFIIKNKLEYVICQQVVGNRKIFEQVRLAADKAGNCKLIFCLHASPDFVFTRPNIRAELFRILHKIQFQKSLKKLMVGLLPVPLYNYLVGKQTKKEYSVYNEYFDKIILLSTHYIDDYCRLSHLPYEKRTMVGAIPNAVSFEQEITAEKLQQKKKEVLIVSRLSDRQKRISDSLKIWKKVQQRADFDKDWMLNIVGTGEDEAYYKHLVRKWGVKNVVFCGRQNPVGYYEQASIYMMTSAFEGFPMTLVEAQQTAVVPIVYDSFGALHDVVQHKQNGCIVKQGDEAQFCTALLDLMANKPERINMAETGLNDSKKFSTENVVAQWMKLFDEME